MAENNRSTFDFSDQYGSDPIFRRYRPTNYMDIRETESATRSAVAQRELSEANLAKAQAELSAQLAPMKAASDAIASMSSLIKTRTALQDEAAIRRDSAAISESIGQAGDLKSLTALGQSNRMGLKDEETKMLYTDRATGLFTSATINAQNPFEVDRVFSEMDPMVAALPEMQTAYKNIREQAERRFNVSTTYAAKPSLGVVPTTQGGQVDVTAAGLEVAAETGREERRKSAAETLKLVQNRIRDLQSKIADDTDQLGKADESDMAELKQLNVDSRNLMIEVMQRGGVESGTVENRAEQFASLFPSSANTGPAAAAAASSAATGGATAAAPTPVTTAPAPPTPAVEAPPAPPAPVPKSLEEELAEEIKSSQQEAVRPVVERIKRERAEVTEKAKRRARAKELRDEKTRLEKALYTGTGSRRKLKAGLSENSDAVRRTQARIDEITAELGK